MAGSTNNKVAKLPKDGVCTTVFGVHLFYHVCQRRESRMLDLTVNCVHHGLHLVRVRMAQNSFWDQVYNGGPCISDKFKITVYGSRHPSDTMWAVRTCLPLYDLKRELGRYSYVTDDLREIKRTCMRHDYVPARTTGSEDNRGDLYFIPGVEVKGGFKSRMSAWAYIHYGVDIRGVDIINPVFFLTEPLTKLEKNQGMRVAYYGVRNAHLLREVDLNAGDPTADPEYLGSIVAADISVYRTLMLSDGAEGRAFRTFAEAKFFADNGSTPPPTDDSDEEASAASEGVDGDNSASHEVVDISSEAERGPEVTDVDGNEDEEEGCDLGGGEEVDYENVEDYDGDEYCENDGEGEEDG